MTAIHPNCTDTKPKCPHCGSVTRITTNEGLIYTNQNGNIIDTEIMRTFETKCGKCSEELN